jgi:hypothetical protein
MIGSTSAQRDFIASGLSLVATTSCCKVGNRPDTQTMMGMTVPRSL